MATFYYKRFVDGGVIIARFGIALQGVATLLGLRSFHFHCIVCFSFFSFSSWSRNCAVPRGRKGVPEVHSDDNSGKLDTSLVGLIAKISK